MTPPIKGVAPVDFAVIAANMALMPVIGVYAMGTGISLIGKDGR